MREQGLVVRARHGIVVAVALAAAAFAAPASAAAPSVVNSGGATFAESLAAAHDGSGRPINVTVVARHDAGRRITQIQFDWNWNGSIGDVVSSTQGTSPQFYGSGATNFLETSVVSHRTDLPNGMPNGGRRVDIPLGLRVIDDAGQASAWVAYTLHVVEDDQSTGNQDYPFMYGQTQTGVLDLVPGQNATFQFRCDDADVHFFSSDDDCDRYRYRWRRLNDGAATGTTQVCCRNDNDLSTLTVSFPSRGFYVLEAQLGNENGNYPDGNGWWRIGAARVNDAGGPSTSLSLSGLFSTSPATVNQGASVTATASLSAVGAGKPQVIEWDPNGDGAFDRREWTVPTGSTGASHPDLSLGERQQAVNTSSHGTKTVRARALDNGALDAADNARRAGPSASASVYVNAVPTAADVSRSTNEDTAVAITLAGSDADSQPVSLTYDLVSQPASGSVSLSGSTATYTPPANFHGTVTFFYTAKDGPHATAWATSNQGKVTVTVNAVNDAPTAGDVSVSTAEDTAKSFIVPVADADGDPLTITPAQPANGSVACNGTQCTYTPMPDFHGTDTFTYVVQDPSGATDTGQVVVTVTPVNDAPSAGQVTITTDEDQPVEFDLVATDVDGDPLTYQVLDDPADGTVSCTPQGRCVYTPDDNFHGSDSFRYAVSDGRGGVDTANGQVLVAVDPVNDLPVAQDGSLTTDEDTPGQVTVQVTDADGDTLTITPTNGANGTVQCIALTCTYTPKPDFNGSDAFTYTASDGNGGSATANVSVTVRPVNDPPVAGDLTIITDEDTPVAFDLVATDVDGDALHYRVITPPTAGTIECDPDGRCAYSPRENVNGGDMFLFEVSDGQATDTAKVLITVNPVNDAPVARDGSLTTDEDTPGQIAVDATDVDNEPLTITPTDGANGTVQCADLTCTYTPAANFHGPDVFTYTAKDPDGASDTATVTVTVNSVNDAPVGDAQMVSTDEDTPVEIVLTGSDVDGDALTFATGQPSHGSVICDGARCLYSPAKDFDGEDAFTFTVRDPQDATGSSRVDVVVRPVNDPPEASDGQHTLDEDTTADIDLQATDPEGDALTYEIVAGPANGDVSCTDSQCTYTPDANYSGDDSLAFRATDTSGASDTAVVTLAIEPVNDRPVAEDLQAATEEDTPLTLALEASDVDDDVLDYEISDAPDHGTVACNEAACTYTPEADYFGTDSFEFTATDAQGASDTGRVTIQIEEILFDTRMVAEPLVATKTTNVQLRTQFRAHLTRTTDGAGVAGRSVAFVVGGQTMCTAKTNAAGTAECTRSISALIGMILAPGYEAIFAGDPDYVASSAHGSLAKGEVSASIGAS